MNDIVPFIVVLLALATPIALVICLRDDYVRRKYLLPDLEGQEVDVALARFLKGFTFEQSATGFVLRIATRSRQGFFLVPFSFLWTGWWLALFYGLQLIAKEFNLIASLVGLPFVTAGTFFCFHALRFVLGHVTLAVDGEKGLVLEGIGRFGWRTAFDWSSVSQIYKSRTWLDRNGIPHSKVVLVVGGKLVAFGDHPVSEPTRRLIVAILRKMRADCRRSIAPASAAG